MENCLVSKLKGVVSNENLPMFNAIDIYVNGSVDFVFSMGLEGGTLSWSGGSQINMGLSGEQAPQSSPYTVPQTTSSVFVLDTISQRTKLNLRDYYDLYKIAFRSTGVSCPMLYNCLKYMSSLKELQIQSVATDVVENFNISDIASTTLERLVLEGVRGSIYGNISVFANTPNLIAFSTDFTYNNIEGDISSLSGCLSLTNFDARSTGVYGTVESLVQGLRNNGKTSGTLEIQLGTSQATLNSNVINKTLMLNFGSSECTVKDRTNTVIATYNVSQGTWSYT